MAMSWLTPNMMAPEQQQFQQQEAQLGNINAQAQQSVAENKLQGVGPDAAAAPTAKAASGGGGGGNPMGGMMSQLGSATQGLGKNLGSVWDTISQNFSGFGTQAGEDIGQATSTDALGGLASSGTLATAGEGLAGAGEAVLPAAEVVAVAADGGMVNADATTTTPDGSGNGWADMFNRAVSTTPAPGDDTQPANSFKNFINSKVGLPLETTAQMKQSYAALPQAMGMGTMGTTSLGAGDAAVAKNALLKLKDGVPWTELENAEQMIISKLRGNTVHVVEPIAPNTANRVAAYAKGGQVKKVNLNAYADGGEVDDFSNIAPQAPVQTDAYISSAQDAPFVKNANVIQAGAGDVPNAPEADPTNVQLPQAQSGANPVTDAIQSQQLPGMAGVQNQISGIQKQANAEGAQGKAETAAADEAGKNLQNLGTVYNQKLQGLEHERQSIVDDMQNGHIDPNHYVNNMSTTGKVSTAIGLLLGGIGSAYLGAKNPAMEYLNKQIDNDVDAQKANMQNKQNLLHAVQQEFGNLNDSTQAMRVIYASKYSNDIAKAAAQSKDPLVHARAQQAIGAIQAQYAPLMQQIALKQTVQHGLNTGQVKPEQAVPYVVPEAHQKDVFGEISKAQAMKQNEASVLQNFDQAAKDNTIVRRIGLHAGAMPASSTNAMNLMMPVLKDNEGRINQTEVEMMQDFMPKPGDTDTKIAQKRQGLMQFIQAKKAAPTARAYGIDLDKTPSTAVPSPNVQMNTNVAPDYNKRK